MKKIFFSFLCLLMLGLSGCFKQSDYIATFKTEPAIFTYYLFVFPAIETRGGMVLAPELENEPLYSGNLLWVDFQINYDKQPYSDVVTATILNYQKIYSTDTMTGRVDEMTEDGYDAPIDYLFPEIKFIGKMMFLWFGHIAPKEQTYEYKMFYDPNDPSEIQTLYVKAQKTNEVTDSNIELTTCFGFDLTSFIDRYEFTDKQSFQYTVKYCIGTKNGFDEYKSIEYSPRTWRISTD